MRPLASAHVRLLAIALALALTAGSAHAALSVGATRIAGSGFALRQVTLTLAPEPSPVGALTLHLAAAHADVPALGWRGVALALDGTLLRGADGRWHLDGPLQVRGAPGGALATAQLGLLLDPAEDSLEAVITQRGVRLAAAVPLDTPSHVELRLDGLPLAWLQGALAQAWKGASVAAGTLDGTLAVDLDPARTRVSGRLSLDGFGFSAAQGATAAQQFGARGDVSFDQAASGSRFSFDGALRGGQLLAGRFYVALPARDAELHLSATRAADGALSVPRLRYDDVGGLRVDAALTTNAAGTLTSLRVDHFDAHLPQALQRYGQGALSAIGYPGLEAVGRVQGQLAYAQGALTRLQINLDRVDVADGGNRFAVSGLNGGIDWRQGAAAPATTLMWSAASVYRVPLGAATLRWHADGDALALSAPAAVPLLGGQLLLQRMALYPGAGKGSRLVASLALAGVDLGQLSGALGWPAFRGTLGGALPDLRVGQGRIALDGGLSLNVFGGFVDVTRLALAHPFGPAPELAADLNLKDVELAPLTGVFDFGQITGTLDGSVRGLRLVDWKPVAFDASLRADHGGRISQRAVKNLTEVGGGGLAGGLQAAVLSIFSSFSYGRIGLSCTLAGNVCTMGGVAPAEGGGYMIVEGSGLPYIKVIGHQTRVDWPTLLSRLRAATSGQAPVIR